MKISEMVIFIKNNDQEKLLMYYGELNAEIGQTNKLINKLYFILLITAIIYYLYITSSLSSFEFSVIKLSDLKLIAVATPPVFTLTSLYIITTRERLNEQLNLAKLISYKLYKTGTISRLEIAITQPKNHIRLIQPFSLITELMKWDRESKTYVVEKIIRFPVLLLSLLPVYFVYTSTKNLHLQYDNSITSTIALGFTYWMIFYILLLFIRMVRIDVNHTRKEGELLSSHTEFFNSK